MPHRRSQQRPEDGQILAIFAGALVLLILVSGLVIDGGNVFLTRRDSQNSADLGSMAGTKRLADYYVKNQAYTGTDNVYTAIATRMVQNDCSAAVGSICSWTARYVGPRTGTSFQDLGPVASTDTAPPGFVSGQKALGVKVDVTKTPQTYLLGVMGKTSWTVQTTATSVTGQPTGAPPNVLLPIAMVAPTTMAEGSIYALTSGSNGPGNFGWLSWDGSNTAGALATSLCTPNNPGFTLPYVFPGDPGVTNASDVRACLQDWVGKTVLIPIVEAVNDDPTDVNHCDTGGQGNGFRYCVIAIAAFVVTGYTQPAVDQINGLFNGTVPYSINGNSNVPGAITQPPTPGSNFYYLGLAQ
jgi:Flp pilus assembly protein TadG